MIAILLCTVFIGECFAYYSYSPFIKDKQEVDIDSGATTSAIFDVVDNDYYKVYFFASPYYATGMEETPDTDTDPLNIAKSENNPYNSTEKLMMMYQQDDSKFQNMSGYYACYKNKNDNGTYEMFEKRDYTGYIRQNEELGIEKTSTYISITVKGSISAEQLSGIVAASEFKDRYGFGPEFIGWTYDKNNTYSRAITTDGKRYGSNDQLRYGNEKGEDVGFYGTQIGNYGCQGVIDQVSSTTSLRDIDSDNRDGSNAGDKIIYLYPVFVSKNYSKKTNVGGKQTDVIKFRINPGDNYGDKQTDEIYYPVGSEEKKRYTVCLFQNVYENNNVNYYTKNLYIDTDTKIQLDCDPDWRGTWKTILSYDVIKDMVTENGYYNIDITCNNGAYIDLDAVVSQYEATNKYVKVAGYDSGGYYFVIGIQKVDDFYLVGEDLSGATGQYKDYDAMSLHTTTIGGETYYIANNLYLESSGKLSIIESLASESNCPLSSMSDNTLKTINEAVASDGKSGYSTFGDGYISLIETENAMSVGTTGNYNLVFVIDYKDGVPSSIEIAYRKNEKKFLFAVMKDKPDTMFYTKYDMLAKETDFYVACEVDAYSTLLSTQVMYKDYRNPDRYDDVNNEKKTIAELFDDYKVTDLATGMELNEDLFENGMFYLNRNYIVYLEPKT